MKTTKLNSTDIINIRKSLDADINKYWKIIRNENIMSIKDIKAGMGSGMELKALYNTITQLQERRIIIKGLLAALNNKITTFNYDDFKKSNNYSIFAACEAKEAIAQLKLIKTLNPTEKAKKGKSGLTKKETFTKQKIDSLIHKHQLEANKFDAAMEKFNSSTDIEISADIAKNFESNLTA